VSALPASRYDDHRIGVRSSRRQNLSPSRTHRTGDTTHMIRAHLIVAGLALFLLCLSGLPSTGAEDKAPKKFMVYVGTYTSDKKSEGIYRMELDLATGKLSEPKLAGKTVNPSFLAIHPTGKFLYAVGEIDNFGKKGKKSSGAVNAFAIDPKTGDLTLLNQQSSEGGGPCHVVTDKAGKYAFVANYGGGNAAALPIDAEGKLGEATGFVQHKGKKRALAHSINLDAGNRFAVVADAGLDKVFIYRFEDGKLKENDPPHAELKAGAAPRHFAFHPDGKHAYVINESGLSITAFRYDPKKGALEEIQTISTVPPGWKKGSTAEVVVHPSGRFVYGSNRGHDSIAVFKVDTGTGKLTHVENQGKGIKTPRNFAIDPTGKFCLVANQDSHSVIVFKVNQETGSLEPTDVKVEIGRPVCIRFLAWPR
jgi:6-phosphogluconolactonase